MAEFPNNIVAIVAPREFLPVGKAATSSKKDYQALAIALASDPSQLAHFRTTLEDNRRSAPLFDGRLTARALEASYLAIHSRYQSGLPPDQIEIHL